MSPEGTFGYSRSRTILTSPRVSECVSFAIAFMQGSYPLKSPVQYFKDKSDYVGVVNRNYETSKDRANRIEKANKEKVFQHTVFREDEPSRKYFLRRRQHQTERRPEIRFQPRDYTERI